MIPVGSQERRLVHTELAHRPDPAGVVDKRCAVLDNSVHHRLPTHPELAGDLRHRASEFADTTARLGTGPTRQHDLSVQELERLGPRPRSTQRLAAPPPALPDSQARRPAEALQISDVDPHPILAFGPAPAPLAPRPRLGCLNLDRHLTIGLAHARHAHTIESEHGLSQPTTVSHRRDLLAVEVLEQLQRWRDPCTHRGTLTPSSLPTSTRRASNHLRREVELVEWATAPATAGHQRLEPDTDALHDLDASQAEAVTAMLGTTRPVVTVVGPAGAGKTRMLAAAVDSWRHAGIEVFGVGPSASWAQ
jgi:hypothetical protein